MIETVNLLKSYEHLDYVTVPQTGPSFILFYFLRGVKSSDCSAQTGFGWEFRQLKARPRLNYVVREFDAVKWDN